MTTPRLVDPCPAHRTSVTARLGRWLLRGLTGCGLIDAMVVPATEPGTAHAPCVPCGLRSLERHANGSSRGRRGTRLSA